VNFKILEERIGQEMAIIYLFFEKYRERDAHQETE